MQQARDPRLTGTERRKVASLLRAESARWPVEMTPVPESAWPESAETEGVISVWRSRHYVAVVYGARQGGIRITVNRTELNPATGEWLDGITWDELQAIKRALGYGDCYAVEIYPRDADVVNVANLRHLWVLDAPLAIGWFRNGAPPQPPAPCRAERNALRAALEALEPFAARWRGLLPWQRGAVMANPKLEDFDGTARRPLLFADPAAFQTAAHVAADLAKLLAEEDS